MKVEIDREGDLLLTAKNDVEYYALSQWNKNNGEFAVVLHAEDAEGEE